MLKFFQTVKSLLKVIENISDYAFFSKGTISSKCCYSQAQFIKCEEIFSTDDREMSFEDMEDFLKEGTLMLDFKHANVLSLVGVVSEEGERPLVILPYMENGDLRTFIKRDGLVCTSYSNVFGLES